LHLHTLALDVLKTRRQELAETQAKGHPMKLSRIFVAGQPRSGLVFPAPVSGRPIDTFSDIKDALVAALEQQDREDGQNAKVADWRWHDFRRSFATALGEGSIPEAVADAILNHRQSATRGGVLGVYQRASRWPEQVRAMDLWGRLLSSAIDGKEADDSVLPMAVHAG
jgi:integrase